MAKPRSSDPGRWTKEADQALRKAVDIFHSDGMFRTQGERWGAVMGYIRQETGQIYRPRRCRHRLNNLKALDREQERLKALEEEERRLKEHGQSVAITGHVAGIIESLRVEIGKLHGEVVALREQLRSLDR